MLRPWLRPLRARSARPHRWACEGVVVVVAGVAGAATFHGAPLMPHKDQDVSGGLWP